MRLKKFIRVKTVCDLKVVGRELGVVSAEPASASVGLPGLRGCGAAGLRGCGAAGLSGLRGYRGCGAIIRRLGGSLPAVMHDVRILLGALRRVLSEA